MNNYYDLFNLKTDCKEKDIINSYQIKINKYKNLIKISEEDIFNIKILKSGLYILLNSELRSKYDILLKNNNNNLLILKNNNKNIIDNILPNNDDFDINLDTLFNSNNNDNKNNVNKEKKNTDNNCSYINDRTFQNIHKVDKPNIDFNNNIIFKSIQCRKNSEN